MRCSMGFLTSSCMLVASLSASLHLLPPLRHRRPPKPPKPPPRKPPKPPSPKRSPKPPPPKRSPKPPSPKRSPQPPLLKLLNRSWPMLRACCSRSAHDVSPPAACQPLDVCCCQPLPVFLYTLPLASA